MTAIPFTHEITVRWGDCDPAGIVYTGRITDFALEAIDAWWESVIGHGWYALNADAGTGAPFVHMSLDFTGQLTPRHKLVCAIHLLKVGNSSVRFRVVGSQNEEQCFAGEFVEVLVRSKEHEIVEAPDWIMKKLRVRLGSEEEVSRYARDEGSSRDVPTQDASSME